MQMYANFEWIGCVTSPPMMLGGTRTMRRGSVALTTQVLTPGIPGTPGMPDRPGLPLGPVKPVVQEICLIKSNSLTYWTCILTNKFHPTTCLRSRVDLSYQNRLNSKDIVQVAYLLKQIIGR